MGQLSGAGIWVMRKLVTMHLLLPHGIRRHAVQGCGEAESEAVRDYSCREAGGSTEARQCGLLNEVKYIMYGGAALSRGTRISNVPGIQEGTLDR